jgi:Mor family transcriptional regulator
VVSYRAGSKSHAPHSFIFLLSRSTKVMSLEQQQGIFDAIAKSDINDLKAKLSAYNGSVDFTDDNGEQAKKHSERVREN